MSNTNDSKKKDSAKVPKVDSLQSQSKKRWSFIQNDLEKALDTWEELEKTQTPLSQEEEQLVKIKSIINQLKDKLDNF